MLWNGHIVSCTQIFGFINFLISNFSNFKKVLLLIQSSSFSWHCAFTWRIKITVTVWIQLHTDYTELCSLNVFSLFKAFSSSSSTPQCLCGDFFHRPWKWQIVHILKHVTKDQMTKPMCCEDFTWEKAAVLFFWRCTYEERSFLAHALVNLNRIHLEWMLLTVMSAVHCQCWMKDKAMLLLAGLTSQAWITPVPSVHIH